MPVPFLGEIRAFGFGFVPRGWAACDGTVLDISSNQALYSLLGNTYGGDGNRTFALPDLRGRMPTGVDTRDPSLGLGASGGQEAVTLTVETLAPHTHQLRAAEAAPNSVTPIVQAFAPLETGYATSPSAPISMTEMIDTSGLGVGHDTMQPFCTMLICIATHGLYPSTN